MFSGDTAEAFYQRVYALLRTDLISFNLSDIDYLLPFEMEIYFAQLQESLKQVKAEQDKMKSKRK